MNFYDHWLLPPILELVMRQYQLEQYPRTVVRAATRPVLDRGRRQKQTSEDLCFAASAV